MATAMVITLCGSNNFLLRWRLGELVNQFIKKYGELAVERIDAEETSSQGIIDAISSLPFLSKRKLVVLRDGANSKTIMEEIEQIISAVDETTELIFYEPEIDKRSRYFKVLQAKTQLEEFSDLDNYQLAKWLSEEAKKQSGSLKPADANYLVERVGNNQELLANELAKLVIYNSEISRENIKLLTEPTPQSRVFDLLDASFGGDKKRALKLYDEQRAQKVEPQAILAMITWQLELLTLAKVGGGRSNQQIATDTGMKAYPLQKAASLASRLSSEKVRQLVDEAFKIDWHSKTQNLDLDEALKNYIVTI